jgi:hypothetical protein
MRQLRRYASLGPPVCAGSVSGLAVRSACIPGVVAAPGSSAASSVTRPLPNVDSPESQGVREAITRQQVQAPGLSVVILGGSGRTAESGVPACGELVSSLSNGT